MFTKKPTKKYIDFLKREDSVLTQGAISSKRDPNKLRAYQQQQDDFPEYQNKHKLPDMPFEYDDASLIISPTINTKQRPVPYSMQYNDPNQLSNNENNDEIYQKLDYFSMETAKKLQFQQTLNYSNIKSNINKQIITPSHSNINVRLTKLFYSDTPTQQPSNDVIHNLMSKPATLDPMDISPNVHSNISGEEHKKQLEYEALKMNNSEDEEYDDEEFFEEDSDVVTPNFTELYPDDNEREIEIDKFLEKSPEIDKSAVPPDTLILPVYGTLKDYSKMLNIERNVIGATLRDLGIYTQNVITQEAGQQLVNKLRPNTNVLLETLVDELVSRLPYNKLDASTYSKLSKRKPVLCILGHVDHGKTTLLDYLRHSHVAEHEVGGITQSIGAFTINMKQYASSFDSHYDEIVIFDTPGHAAFTGMRQRGAHVVDIAILVIDTCDGVKPQTKESLAIIRKEKIPFIIALNKVDRDESNVDGVKQELWELGVYEDDIEMVEISGKTGFGIHNLLEMVDIICELEDPRGSLTDNAELVVIEAKKSTQEGTIVNALVQDGLLKNNDYLLKLNGFDQHSRAKITRLHNEKHENIDYAGPSTPVTFLGFGKHLPEIGTILIAAKDMHHAHDIIKMREMHNYYQTKLKLHARVSNTHSKLYDPTRALSINDHQSFIENTDEDNLNIQSKWTSTHITNDPRQLNVWIRADTWGSIEALENYLYQIIIPNNEYYFQIISKDIGALYEQIIRECDSRNCFILNFNVPIKKGNYKQKHVQIFDSNIIFDLFDKFIFSLEDKLAPIEQHIFCGRAYVREIFDVDNNKIAGCIVETGKIKADGHFRVKRDSAIIYEQWGVTQLKHFAKDVMEIEGGDECGLKLEFDDWKEEDCIECLDIISEKNKIQPPIFELDPVLQQSLYDIGDNNNMQINMEGSTVFSFQDNEYQQNQFTTLNHNDFNDENEFIGTKHKNISNATKVKAVKDNKGRVVFESVD